MCIPKTNIVGFPVSFRGHFDMLCDMATLKTAVPSKHDTFLIY